MQYTHPIAPPGSKLYEKSVRECRGVVEREGRKWEVESGTRGEENGTE